MSSPKRRKLNGTSESPALSAFAAFKSLQNKKSSKHATGKSHQNSIQDSKLKPDLLIKNKNPVDEIPKNITENLTSSNTALQPEGTARVVVETAADEPESPLQSQHEFPEVLLEPPSITLTTLIPSKSNVQELKDGTILLKLEPGEVGPPSSSTARSNVSQRLVILGQYGLSVQKGQITLLGSTLQASKSIYKVSVPSSHSLPVIRCSAVELTGAEISLRQCKTGLESLKSLSPLFDRLWNNGSASMAANQKALSKLKTSSFQILFSTDDGPKGAFLQPIISAPEWNEALAKFSNLTELKSSRMFICGPKSSGKSTFTKLLSNRLLSATAEKTSATHFPRKIGIAILDLDPGQPEYSVPGQISLLHLKEPNFGPTYSHPTSDGKNRIIRAHTVGSITPSMDPSLYMACALDLFAHYRNLLSAHPDLPLIINTPGWVLGTGLELLVDLIAKTRPTEIVYMSQEGPLEVVDSLRDAVKGPPVLTLPSQASKYVTKTASQLRTMQAMSYFHLEVSSTKALTWQARPLSSEPPWEIRYAGDNAGILGIMCYGEQPPPDLLLETINGSLLAIVVIDEMAAIPGWQNNRQQSKEMSADNGDRNSDAVEDTELRAVDDASLHPQNLAKPSIVRTPREDLPYFNPKNAICLDPAYSHCVGFALVRGINIPRRRLQISSPIMGQVIQEINEAGKTIVLVGGKFDTPGWAYTEALNLEHPPKTTVNGQIRGVDDDGDEEMNEEDDFDASEASLGKEFLHAPWVERQAGSQGRTVESRVWRVRRDLGRTSD